MRTAKDCQALIRALNDGTVDCLATDHAPHAHDEKNVGMDEANAGLLGMETALPVLLKLMHNKQLSLKRLIYLLTVGPAKIFKLRTGSLKKGWPADIAIFDPNLSNTIDAEKFYSKSRNTPFHGWKLKGKVLCTIYGGKVVYNNLSLRGTK